MKKKLSKADLRQAHQIGGLKTQAKRRNTDIVDHTQAIKIMGIAIIIIGMAVIVALLK